MTYFLIKKMISLFFMFSIRIDINCFFFCTALYIFKHYETSLEYYFKKYFTSNSYQIVLFHIKFINSKLPLSISNFQILNIFWIWLFYEFICFYSTRKIANNFFRICIMILTINKIVGNCVIHFHHILLLFSC